MRWASVLALAFLLALGGSVCAVGGVLADEGTPPPEPTYCVTITPPAPAYTSIIPTAPLFHTPTEGASPTVTVTGTPPTSTATSTATLTPTASNTPTGGMTCSPASVNATCTVVDAGRQLHFEFNLSSNSYHPRIEMKWSLPTWMKNQQGWVKVVGEASIQDAGDPNPYTKNIYYNTTLLSPGWNLNLYGGGSLNQDMQVTFLNYYQLIMKIDFRNEWGDYAVASGYADVYAVNVGTPTPIASETPTPTGTPVGDPICEEPETWVKPPIIEQLGCWVLVPNMSIDLPEYTGLPESVGIPGIEVCVDGLIIEAMVFDFDIVPYLSVMLALILFTYLFRELRS